MNTKSITFTESGESPDFGVFTAGETREVPGEHAENLIKRGLARAAKEAREARAAKPKEGISDGGQ